MHEERKRSNSVMSSGSIISTASSNSHKRGKDQRGKGKDQSNSLQVAGMKLGSNRKGYIPSKYEKSPFINISGGGGNNGAAVKHQDFLIGNGISHSGGGSDGNIKNRPSNGSNGGGDRAVMLSIAARKKEMQVQAEQTAHVIEKNKKNVLDALNKNYRKK